MTAPEIRLPVLPLREAQLWHRLLDLAEVTKAPWTLIGGQMVLLHSLERGHVPPQISQDGDIIGNVRADPAALGRLAADLESLGFTLEAITPEGVGHRYVRDGDGVTVTIDLLAKDSARIHRCTRHDRLGPWKSQAEHRRCCAACRSW